MPIARYKDLCIDANDPIAMGRFWCAALGLVFHEQDGGDTYLTGRTPEQQVWINGVGEPKVAKHRLHLDLAVDGQEGVAALVQAGASIVDATSFPWVAMIDPEGGEFCVFPNDADRPHAIRSLVLDAHDHERVGTWWAEALGGEFVDDPRGFSIVTAIPGAPFLSLDILPVPERKVVKNRIHIDVLCDDPGMLVGRGATVLRRPDDVISWTVLADPEGNEFCAFVPQK